ncbi:MAG: SDR family oxidoreductase [Betaproteobacteria bacterium]|nr:SDR family oxidoreductase [Betaproteobacteria bacterium]
MGAPLIFITGASSGIGWALAEQALARGWRVALVARHTAQLQARLQAQASWANRWQLWSADVGDAAAMQALAQDCLAQSGVPDVVIANAGISLGVDTAEADDLPVFEQLMRTNVQGVVHTFHIFLSAMRARGSGRLVAIASVAGIRGLPGHAAYCASKSAVITYAESLRGELRGSGVGVSTIVPGYVATPLTARNRYAMPFLMQPDAFAQRAWRAIDAGVSYRVIPWPMGVVAKLLRLLSDALFDRLLQGRPRKHRHTQR